ncbi:MAG: hypothetical protein WBR18_04690 [Anaerolineales bacterium]
MTDPEPSTRRKRKPQTPGPSINRMPEGSQFFERIVPLLLIGMGVITTLLILFAAGVLLGFIPFQ